MKHHNIVIQNFEDVTVHCREQVFWCSAAALFELAKNQHQSEAHSDTLISYATLPPAS